MSKHCIIIEILFDIGWVELARPKRRVLVMSNRISVFDVADFFICKAEPRSGSFMTPLRLQKLVYYAQAWSLAILGKELFSGVFRAWVHGPVNYTLWQKYKAHKYRPIAPTKTFPSHKFSEEQLDLLEEVWDVYGQFDPKYLEQLTHSERPWQEAREGYAPGDRCNVIILQETMKQYYSGLANGEEKT
mgnify:CR=1 FL=1